MIPNVLRALCQVLLIVIFVICSMVSLKAQSVTITPTGIVEADLPCSLISEADLPHDYKDVLFDANGNALMDMLFVIVNYSEVPSEVKDWKYIWKGSTVWVFKNIGTSYIDVYSFPMYDGDGDGVDNANCFVMENVGNGRKLYFTGTCMQACAGQKGKEGDSEAVFYLTGTDGESVDIYLHDLILKPVDKNLGKKSFNDVTMGSLDGMAAAFAIGSTGESRNNPFTARFHIAGNNKLIGGATTTFEGSGAVAIVLSSIMSMSGAPIAIRPIADNQQDYTERTAQILFDDKWPTSVSDPMATIHKNGLLELPVEGDVSAPSIDLGNMNGRCEFDGGQYKFHTTRSDNMFFASTMAICYRLFEVMGMKTYGMGGSMSYGIADNIQTTTYMGQPLADVLIKDGTFSTYSAKPADDEVDPIDVVVRGWYQDYTDLRLPYNAKIQGGTFNDCKVYRCDLSSSQGVYPINMAGEALGRKTISISQDDVRMDASNNILPLEETAAATYITETYGKNSLTPIQENGAYYIYPYLPDAKVAESVEKTRNWVTLIPLMGYPGVLDMGGDEIVRMKTIDGKADLKNSYLFYAELNEYTKANATVDLGLPNPVSVQMALDMAESKEDQEITNDANYTIAHGLYEMRSFESNQWYTFTMPFNVHNIYVLETTGDDQLRDGEKLSDFLVRQGAADGKLAQSIINSLCPDIATGQGSGVAMDLIEIATNQIKCPPILLTAYNGSNASTANFYLYEQVIKSEYDYYDYPNEQDAFDMWYPVIRNGSGIWDFDPMGTAEQFSPQWRIAQPTIALDIEGHTEAYTDRNGNAVVVEENGSKVAPKAIMQAGRIYSLFLPSSNKTRYWDGKYLIFEGYGPQTIAGKTNHSNFLTQDLMISTEMGLQGNATFGNYMAIEDVFLPQMTATTVDTKTSYWYDFQKSTAPQIRPGEIYAVLDATNTVNAIGVSRKGMIRRTEITTNDYRPHVGDILLHAYSQQGSIYLFSHADQQVQIVSVDGRVVYSGMLHDGSQERIAVPTGVYVVRSTGQAIKLMVD